MDAEGLSIDDEETQKLKDDLIKEYGFASIDEMIETYGEQEVNESLALLRVERFIVDNANVTEVAGDDADAVERVSEFCKQMKGKRLSFEEVEALFPENTMDSQLTLLEKLIEA